MFIRELLPSDYNAYFLLINEFRKTNFSEEEFINTLKLINISSKIFVIENNGDLVATATIFYEKKFIYNLATLAHIEDVCVKKEFRSLGFGKLIVQHCIEHAKLTDAYKVTLDCSEYNVPFYNKCGFEKRGYQLSILLKDTPS